MEKPLTFGNGVPRTYYTVPLLWRELRILRNDDFDELTKALPSEAGVYVFEGRRDANRTSSVLYIGRAGKEGDGRASQELTDRVPQSLKKLKWSDGHRHYFYSDVWDLVVRVAVCAKRYVVRVESLLITAHSPAFNAQKVRTGAEEVASDLVVLNAGAKGTLLPTVCGEYYREDRWPDGTEYGNLELRAPVSADD